MVSVPYLEHCNNTKTKGEMLWQILNTKNGRKEYYGQLVGYTITSFQLEDDSEDLPPLDSEYEMDYVQFPTFTLSKD